MSTKTRPTLFERLERVYNSDRFFLFLAGLAGAFLFYVCVVWDAT